MNNPLLDLSFKLYQRGINKFCRVCIYMIKNNINGMVYIGRAKGIAKSRFNTHRTELNTGKHKNKYLQNDWNVFGEKNFSFQVVEYVCEKYANEYEYKWIRSYSEKDCYNIKGIKRNDK